jgi:hypothetical protein
MMMMKDMMRTRTMMAIMKGQFTRQQRIVSCVFVMLL